jgi:hypothetical protein
LRGHWFEKPFPDPACNFSKMDLENRLIMLMVGLGADSGEVAGRHYA